jgi:hypothetical protein
MPTVWALEFPLTHPDEVVMPNKLAYHLCLSIGIEGVRPIDDSLRSALCDEFGLVPDHHCLVPMWIYAVFSANTEAGQYDEMKVGTVLIHYKGRPEKQRALDVAYRAGGAHACRPLARFEHLDW